MAWRMRNLLAIATACGLVGGCQLRPKQPDWAADAPPAPAVAHAPYTVSEMRVQSLRGSGFFFTPLHASQRELGEPAARAVAALQQAAAAGRVRPAGPLLMVYHDPSENLDVPVDVEVGWPTNDADPATAGGGPFQVRTLTPLRCATVIYRGPMKHLHHAYEKLIPEMIAAGHVPSAETRESYLVWEEPESPNNVVQIEVGIRWPQASSGSRDEPCPIGLRCSRTAPPLKRRHRYSADEPHERLQAQERINTRPAVPPLQRGLGAGAPNIGSRAALSPMRWKTRSLF